MKGNSTKKRIQERAFAMFCVTLFLMVCLIGGYSYRQIFNSAKYQRYAISQSTGDYYINSPRGAIEDRNGRPLAQSVIAYSMFADPAMLRVQEKKAREELQEKSKGATNIQELEDKINTPEDIAALLAPYLDISEAEILHRITEKDTAFVWLQRRIDRRKYLEIKKVLREHKIYSIAFKEEYKRHYPNGTMLAQVLGFVGIDNDGLSGMEARLNEYIKGTKTLVQLTYDRAGHVILESVLTDRVPKQQDTAQLTIDTTVQFIAEEALAKQMEKSKAVSGSVIIMDPKTGDILAMVNQPSFDPSKYYEYSDKQWKNGAVTDNYEPGSTFKAIIASAALASGKWHVDDVYNDPGYIDVDDRRIQNWDEESNGDVTLLDILRDSINTGMVYLGMKTGPDILLDYIHKFGFGKATDIELPGEGEGILYQKETILPVNTATMSIGQGISVTPLQMVQAFSAFANNGVMVKPHIIKEIRDADGHIIKESKVVELGQPVPKSVVDDINKILEEEVKAGGGVKAHLEGYQFCGKTGTAQIPDPVHGGYYEGRHVASFIGYGPQPDSRFVILVVINQPQGIYYGAQVAAPVFKDIVAQLVRYYQISPTVVYGDKVDKIEKENDYSIAHTPEGQVIIPDFTNWSMGEVRAWLVKANLKFKPQGSGFAISQTPQRDAAVDEGSAVSVEFKRDDINDAE